MEITCENCGKKYRIDESKLPPREIVYIKCKNCEHKITIEPGIQRQLEPAEPSQKTHLPTEYFEPGVKTALLYCEDIRAGLEINRRLSKLDYETREIKNRDEARHQFRYNIFDVVILYQIGPAAGKNLSDILDFINDLAPDIRRKAVVVLIHPGGNRHNIMDAFSKGVDVTLNPTDLGHIKKIIPQLIDEKQINYKIFYECMENIEAKLI